MKTFIIFATITICLSSCVITKKSNLGFVKNKHIDKNAEVHAVSVSTFLVRPMVRMALKNETTEDSESLRALSKSIKGVRVLSIENQSNNDKINQRLDQYLENKNYQEWLSVHADGEHIRISAKEKKTKIKKVLLSVNSADGDNVFVRIKGKIDLNAMTATLSNMTDKNFKLKTKKGTEVAIN